MLASEARHELEVSKRLGEGLWVRAKGGGLVRIPGRHVNYYTFNGLRWESAGGKFLTSEARPGSYDQILSHLADGQLKEEGVVTRPMLEAALNANWLQRALAALMWAGTFFFSTMLVLTIFQAAAWTLGAFIRFLLAWSRSSRVSPTVSL